MKNPKLIGAALAVSLTAGVAASPADAQPQLPNFGNAAADLSSGQGQPITVIGGVPIYPVQLIGAVGGLAVLVGAIVGIVKVVQGKNNGEDPGNPANNSKPGNSGAAGNLGSPWEPVLANPSKYWDKGSMYSFVPNGKYEYAIVEATGDSTPELLLRQGGTEVGPVYLLTLRNNVPVRLTPNLEDGASTAGGYRGSVWASKSGNGVWQATGVRNTPNTEYKRMNVRGNRLSVTETASMHYSKDHPDVQKANWCPVTNRSCLPQ